MRNFEKADLPGALAPSMQELSAALDEIYMLRAILADEAQILSAHLEYKTFPKSRRKFAEEQVARMRRFANGELHAATRESFNTSRALRVAGAPETLTRGEWALSRGIKIVDPNASEPEASQS